MKLTLTKTTLALIGILTLSGCDTLPTLGDNSSSSDGAPVSETGDGGYGGAEASGASGDDGWGGQEVGNGAQPGGVLLSTLTVYFDYDISEIRRDFADVVIAHGEYLAANPNVTITVEGHCDENGSREYNIGLGEHRANAVKNLLLAQGASEQQVITISYGEERPAIEGSTEESWSLNRRVELVY